MGLRGDRAAGEDEAGRPRTLRPPSSTQPAFLQRGPSLREPTLQTLLSPNLSPGAQGSALTATSLAVSHGSHQLSGLGWFILSLPLPLTVQTREREGSGKSTPSSLAANEKRKEGGLTETPTWERPPHHLPPKGPALPEAPRGPTLTPKKTLQPRKGAGAGAASAPSSASGLSLLRGWNISSPGSRAQLSAQPRLTVQWEFWNGPMGPPSVLFPHPHLL